MSQEQSVQIDQGCCPGPCCPEPSMNDALMDLKMNNTSVLELLQEYKAKIKEQEVHSAWLG